MQNQSADRLSFARSYVPLIAPADAARLQGQSNVIFLDVRALTEVEELGQIKGALHIPRELIELKADPKSPSHVSELAIDKTIIVYGATAKRSASAAAALKQLGFADVRDMGAFEYWKQGGGAVECLDQRRMILQRA